MVQEAEALEKPGRPTFFEMPAWSFNIEMGPVGWLDCWEGGNAEFIAAVKQPRYAGTDTNNGTDKSGRGD
jgi:hypothetical protein